MISLEITKRGYGNAYFVEVNGFGGIVSSKDAELHEAVEEIFNSDFYFKFKKWYKNRKEENK
jgi:hypothetical protein